MDSDSAVSNKIAACWLGKSIGGTLGMPVEGWAGPHSISFYDPVPTAPAPNDDLDLQVVWLHHLLTEGKRSLAPGGLATAWQRHVRFPWDEYGCALRNFHYGLSGHHVGGFDNWFGECMGAAIRSELWACMAPGDPRRAAGYAYCDSVTDHSGDGIWAIVFLAALQSAAFTEHRQNVLLDQALAFLPPASRVRRAIEDTRRWWQEARGDEEGWIRVQRQVLSRYGTANFTDVTANLAYTVLGWLAGEGDFGRSLCIAVNCGLDSDCTAASLGALLGILDPQGIPEEWIAPIGDRIVLSPGIVNLEGPGTTSVLTEWTLRLRHQLRGDSPSMGEVLPRRPACGEGSPITVPLEVSWARDRSLVHEEEASGKIRDLLDRHSDHLRLPGHWTRRGVEDFAEDLLLARSQFVTVEEGPVRVMAFSSDTLCRAWLDGVPLAPASYGPGCHDSKAPSFHRGGPGVFEAPHLPAGSHELLIACEAPEKGWTDLVLGVGDGKSHLWEPFALAAARDTSDASHASDAGEASDCARQPQPMEYHSSLPSQRSL